MEKYRCPILEEMGAYDEEYPSGKYDPRHYDSLPDMIRHLRVDNHWTDKEVANWQETARPITDARTNSERNQDAA